jgi:hypothetical protein
VALNHHTLLACIALTMLSASPLWADDVLEVHQQGDMSYVTGGIGEDESDALQATQHNYNLHVMNADKDGHFSDDIRIVISDPKHTVLLDTVGGPLFYANVPSGRYLVEGFSDTQSKKQTVTIAGNKTVRVRFVWPQDATD